jgi:hypothetical protein
MLPSSRTTNSFSGKIHLIFEKSQDALAFVQKSELASIIYVNDYVLQLCNGYTLVCKMLVDCDDKDENDIIKQTDQLRFRDGKYIEKKGAILNQRGFCRLKKDFVHEAKLKNSFAYNTKSLKKTSRSLTIILKVT